MNKQEMIAKLIEQLKLALTRPALFMGETTVNAAISFLNGMGLACHAVGIAPTLDTKREAVKSRGWEFGPTGGLAYMREANLTEEQIVQELLRIEIKMLELVAEGLAD